MGNDLTFSVVAKDFASGTFSKVGKSAKQSETSMSKFGDSAKKALGAVLAFETAKTVTKGLLGMAKAAAEDQASVALLARQFRASAHATKAQIDQNEEYITSLGRTKGIADDVARQSLGTLITATHDVTKAQKLNNLAIDVAAAKGKPLAAVSLALTKAYNGNVGGLGRLGIKTKDAAGKTLSFAAAQKQLQKQFGGAAAAKAKTFTGAVDRFQVAVQEGGEAIGYKLLPALTKFVPKVTNFINGMQDGTGAGGEFVDKFKSEVVPVLSNLAAEAKVVGSALRPFLDLLLKLPPQAVAFGGASAILGTKLGGLRAPLEEGASGFSKMGRAAASAAGGAGLLAVADAANRTSPAVAGLEGALGGAVAGFAATGNPIGALIGGVGGGLLGIFSSSKKAAVGMDASAVSAQKAKGDLDTLSDSITDVTKGYDALAKQQIRKATFDALGGAGKAAEAVNDLGISLNTLTNAALGNPKAIAAVDSAVTKAKQGILTGTKLTDALGDSYVAVTEKQKKASGAAVEISMALGLVAKKTKDERTEAIVAQLATDKFAKALKSVPDSKVIKLGTEGARQARADLIDLASRGKGLSDKQIRILLGVANLPKTKADIAAIQAAADRAARSRVIKFTAVKVGFGSVAGALGGSKGNGIPGDGIGSDGRQAGRNAGNGYVDAFVAAVIKGRPKVKTALERASSLVNGLKDRISSLQDTRSGFASTFQADNLFGTDLSEGGGIGALLANAQKQKDIADQLKKDLATVSTNGLSKDLLKQLQSQGLGGADALHALATGTTSQIAAFNALNGAASKSLTSTGLTLGNSIRGGNIDSDIAQANQALVIEQAMTRALGKLKLTTTVKGGDLIVAVRTTNHNRGRQPGDFSK